VVQEAELTLDERIALAKQRAADLTPGELREAVTRKKAAGIGWRALSARFEKRTGVYVPYVGKTGDYDVVDVMSDDGELCVPAGRTAVYSTYGARYALDGSRIKA